MNVISESVGRIARWIDMLGPAGLDECLLSGATKYAEKLPALVGKLSATDVSATCEFLAYATGMSRLTGEIKESESCGYAIPLQICLDVDVLIFAVMHKIGIGEIAAPEMPDEFEEVLYFQDDEDEE